MAIQIARAKSFINDDGEKVNYFKILDNWNYQNLQEMFLNVEQSMVTATDRVNLFYTLHHHMRGERKADSFSQADVIPFDLDGIDLDRIDMYPPLVAEVCGFDLDKCAVIYSGNGIHILVAVKPQTSLSWFKDNKLGYKQLLKRIEKKCKEVSLPYTLDSTAWDCSRVFRLPFSINRKEGKEDKECRLISKNLITQDFELPHVERVEKSIKKGTFGVPDHETILKECNFFKWLKDEPNEVHEPHAYAMLSISGYFNDGALSSTLFTAFSSPSINSKSYDEFKEQALEASGPRTCSGINDVWSKCSGCKHFKSSEIASPIQIKGANHIGTEHCGFSTIIRSESGSIKTIKRAYEDLRLFYSRKYSYIYMTDIKRIMIYEEGKYIKTNDDDLKCFAQEMFLPLVEKEEERKQFLFQVKASPTNRKTIDFIHGTKNEGLINLANGVYDLKKKELLKHSPDYGFIYKLPYDYVEDATCPTWELLLKNLTVNRPELIDLIEEAIAFTIGNVPYTKFQHYFLLTGGGSNGKSTFINIFKMLLGSENSVSITLDKLLNKEYYVAQLEGKLANMVADEDAEAFEKKASDNTLLKALTGGDAVSTRVIYESPMQFVNRAKFFYAFNNIPKIGIKSHGDGRRPLIIPFDAELDKCPELKIDDVYDKIEGELSGILNRIIIAYDRLLLKGFTKTTLTTESLRKSRVEHDPIYDFLSNELVIDANSSVVLSEIFTIFSQEGNEYCNPKYPIMLRTFITKVRNVLSSDDKFCNVSLKRNVFNNKKIYMLIGMGLREKPDF